VLAFIVRGGNNGRGRGIRQVGGQGRTTRKGGAGQGRMTRKMVEKSGVIDDDEDEG